MWTVVCGAVRCGVIQPPNDGRRFGAPGYHRRVGVSGSLLFSLLHLIRSQSRVHSVQVPLGERCRKYLNRCLYFAEITRLPMTSHESHPEPPSPDNGSISLVRHRACWSLMPNTESQLTTVSHVCGGVLSLAAVRGDHRCKSTLRWRLYQPPACSATVPFPTIGTSADGSRTIVPDQASKMCRPPTSLRPRPARRRCRSPAHSYSLVLSGGNPAPTEYFPHAEPLPPIIPQLHPLPPLVSYERLCRSRRPVCT